MYFLICHDLCLFGFLFIWSSKFDVTEAYDNVALYKPAYQLSSFGTENLKYDAANAVDGLKSDLSIDGGQCAVSAVGYATAIWRVDLGSVHYIDHITLYFMTNNQAWDETNNRISSFLGFSLYVSNSTNRLLGRLCFRDTQFNKTTIPEVFNTTCNVFGQYIIYYNERLPGVDYPCDYNINAENDLCEVEVYGCPTLNPDCDVWDPIMCACLVCKPSYMDMEPHHETTDWPIGSYGYYYDEMCGHCKDPTQCSPYTGICLTGCSAGYFGPSCKEECRIGNYGYNCNETCGHCKDLSQCSTTSGFCHTGCSDGYTGGLCKKKCDIGLYGYECLYTCGHCIDPAECNHVSGTCRTGCAAGYRGRLCIEHCDVGHYGYNCNETCGHCYEPAQCSNVSGTCRTGCGAGYSGRLCKDECDIGLYGDLCYDTCGHCIDQAECNHVTGTCRTGCAAGFRGRLCIEHCDIGNYGYNCNETCGHCNNATQCSTVTGTCRTGCEEGYIGRLCKDECDIGLHGYECYDTCGHCIDPAECNHVTGTCRTGCAAGYRGRLCIEHCDIGHYGYNCNETCGHCNNATQCSTVAGTCRTGCEAGYSGRLCKDVDQEKVMAISSLYGLIGVICFLVIIIGALVLYIVLTRISIARNNARQQQNKEMVPAVYNDTFDAFDNKGCNIEYMEIGEPSYINMNARGLV